ncbi:FtsX-like permease family protein [Sphaerisporangium rubeum]|uniref:Putative ABC transport system permease protein n=1 Tax=Sphaerisporangium rubeum TaxID=321317 RepID=A0A7X0M4Y5_9ACTN|nr:FtsX-like permease family protein [Sphaerisporangium rubeum]MBB6471770.1 putative ABC transport system permease protein [Sphaerisporangium rubeum]
MRIPRLPVLHWPSVRGRARADAGPLLLVAAVVVVVTLLAGAVPPLMRATADAAVQDAVRRAGTDADVTAHANWERDDGPGGGRARQPQLPEDIDTFRQHAVDNLDPTLTAALRAPVASATSVPLKITDGSVLRTFTLAYLADDNGGPRVTWVEGGPPKASVTTPGGIAEIPYQAPPWPVQVGLSEADAKALGRGPGDDIPLMDDNRQVKKVKVSGVFRPADPADPAWRLLPWLLSPAKGADGIGSTRLAGLLSRDSLPDARLALEPEQFDRAVSFSPDASVLDLKAAEALTTSVVGLKANSSSSAVFDSSLKWATQLDNVLVDIRTRVAAMFAQSSVLLTGILAAAVLVLLLAAELLVRRRAPGLTGARQRGAGLPDLAAELLLESTLVALAAAATGLALAGLVAPGTSLEWAVPVVVAAVVAGPAFGVLAAARATRDKRVPANRAARRSAERTVQLRRATVEVAAMITAVAAFVALFQRGIVPAGTAADATGQDGGASLPASAPALGVVAGTLLLLRLLPAGTGAALKRALRSRRPLAVFGSARAVATSARVLPLMILVTSAALASYAFTLDATAGRGMEDGAWRTVGADARLDMASVAAGSTAAVAERVAAAPGVTQALAGQVSEFTRVSTPDAFVQPRLVVVDTRALRRLEAATPLPKTPGLDRLAAAGTGDVPALVRSSDGTLRPGMKLRLLRADAPPIPLVAVGTAPAIGDATDLVLVDAAALTAAGMPPEPNTIWVTGPGAARAVAANAVAAAPLVRADVLEERRAAPLTSGLLRLAWASAAMLLALGLLGLALGAAGSAPDRWQTLTRLRTLGLRPRDTRWVAAGELLPPVVAAAVLGPLLGVLLARLTLGSLALRLITGQTTDPALVPPWWWLAVMAAGFVAAVAVVVPVEAALRRRRRLSEVLRAGGS